MTSRQASPMTGNECVQIWKYLDPLHAKQKLVPSPASFTLIFSLDLFTQSAEN